MWPHSRRLPALRRIFNYAIHPAARAVIDLQAAGVSGQDKWNHRTEWARQFTWKELFVALTDILVVGESGSRRPWMSDSYSTTWRTRLLGFASLDELGLYDGRHDGLRFLAWLFQGWPDGEWCSSCSS